MLSQWIILESGTEWVNATFVKDSLNHWVFLESGIDCGLIHHPISKFKYIPHFLSQFGSEVEKELLLCHLGYTSPQFAIAYNTQTWRRPDLHLSCEWCQLGRQRRGGVPDQKNTFVQTFFVLNEQ